MCHVNCMVSHVSLQRFMLWCIALSGINYLEFTNSVCTSFIAKNSEKPCQELEDLKF